MSAFEPQQVLGKSISPRFLLQSDASVEHGMFETCQGMKVRVL
jgi:hypothetical protein